MVLPNQRPLEYCCGKWARMKGLRMMRKTPLIFLGAIAPRRQFRQRRCYKGVAAVLRQVKKRNATGYALNNARTLNEEQVIEYEEVSNRGKTSALETTLNHGAKRHCADATRPSPVRLRHELAVLNARRHIDRAGRRPPELHQHDKAPHHQYQ